MIETAADRQMFLNSQEFGITARLVSDSSGAERELNGIFDAAHFSLDLGAGSVSTRELQFTCATEDTEGFTQDDVLEIAGVRYVIADLQPDGTGITVLKLNRG
jgi:hypothetical protein